MPAVFRRRFKGRPSPNWWLQFRDHAGIRRQLPGLPRKSDTRRLANLIACLVDARAAGDAESLGAIRMQVLRTSPARVVRRLGDWGVIRAVPSPGRSFEGQLMSWRDWLTAADRTPGHVRDSVARVRSVAAGVGAVVPADLQADAVAAYLARRRASGLSSKTSNHYLAAVRAFCGFLVRQRWLDYSPVEACRPVRQRRVRPRRVLPAGDLLRLIGTTLRSDVVHHRMTGGLRGLLYRFAASTGLRAGEIARLRHADIDLVSGCVRVRSEVAKSGRSRVVPIGPDLVEALRRVMERTAAGPVFVGFDPRKASRMLRRDLRAAAVAYRDDSGAVFDFHALRRQFASDLLAQGTSAAVAQALLGHSTARMTLEVYSQSARDEHKTAIKGLDRRFGNWFASRYPAAAKGLADTGIGHEPNGPLQHPLQHF